MINEELVGKSVEVGCRVSQLSLDLILKALDYLGKKIEGNQDNTHDTPTAVIADDKMQENAEQSAKRVFPPLCLRQLLQKRILDGFLPQDTF